MDVVNKMDWLDADAAAATIVVIGESQSAVEILESAVVEQGFRLFSATEGPESGIEGVPPDLIILDVGENEGHARVERRLSQIRSQWAAAILCLVPQPGRLNHEAIAQLSAEDYLLKPLRVLELWSRVRVLLQRRQVLRISGPPLIDRRSRGRRKEDRDESPESAVDNRCVVDESNKSVVLEGRTLDLTPKEYELFCLLLKHEGQVLSPREIVKQLWPDTRRASASDVHQYMHLLRRKVEPELSRPRWILTVRGFGYKLMVPDPS